MSTQEHTPEGAGDEAAAPAEEDDVVEGTVIEAVSAADLGLKLPDDADEAVAVLLQELSLSRTDANEYLDNLQRVAAEFDNFRRRTLRERAELSERASQGMIEKLLPVLDSFDSAFTHEAQTPTEELLLTGMRGTYQQLFDLLQKEGLEPIPADEGDPFDPELHEAVSSAATGDGAPVVAQELRRGYRLQGRVIRPALVAVGHA